MHQKKALVARAAEEIKQSERVVQVAEAALASGKAKVKEMQADRIRAKAEFERWRVELHRVEELAKKGLVDQQTLDVTRFQAEAAKAQQAEVEAKLQSSLAMVQENEAQLLKARVDVRVAETKHQVAQADEEYTQALVGYTRLEAPFAGVVTVRNVNTGDFVQPAAGTKGEPLFVVGRAQRRTGNWEDRREMREQEKQIRFALWLGCSFQLPSPATKPLY